jgi:hypothetical protein
MNDSFAWNERTKDFNESASRFSHHISAFSAAKKGRDMPLSDFQKRWCSDIMNQLSKFEITKVLFADMADASNPRSSFQRIKVPIDVGVINRRLSCDDYDSLSSWCNDVNLMWFNAKSCFQEGSANYLAAEYLKSWFEKKVAVCPLTAKDEWLLEFKKIQKKVDRLLKDPVSKKLFG